MNAGLTGTFGPHKCVTACRPARSPAETGRASSCRRWRPRHLLAANSANSVGANTTRIAAPALGGLLIGVLGFTFTITATVVILAGAAMLIARLPPGCGDPDTDSPAGTARERPSSVLADWWDGIRELRRTVDARAVASLQALDAVKEGIISTVFPVLMLGVIAASPAEMGLVNSGFAITAVLVAPFIPWLVKRAGYGRAVGMGAVIAGLVMFPLVFWPSLWLALATFLVSGAPFTVSLVSSNTLLIASVRESHRSRAVGMMATIYAIFMLVSAAIAGLAADASGVLPVLGVAATRRYRSSRASASPGSAEPRRAETCAADVVDRRARRRQAIAGTMTRSSTVTGVRHWSGSS